MTPDPFNSGQRELQERFDTRRLADTLAAHPLYSPEIDEAARRFVERADMVFIATADAAGLPDCTYKGGEPGFIRVLDDRTLALPSYDGNGIFASFGNVLVNPQVGLLFIDFVSGNRLRMRGEATIDPDDPLLPGYPGVQFVVRIRTTLVYPNCRRYVHRYQLVERSPFVPKAGVVAPVPDWKQEDWACDSLPAADPARDPAHPVAPAAPSY